MRKWHLRERAGVYYLVAVLVWWVAVDKQALARRQLEYSQFLVTASGVQDFRSFALYCEQLVRQEPYNAKYRAVLGDTYALLGDRRRAIENYRRAVTLAPGVKAYRQRLEALYQESGYSQTHP